MTSDEAQELIHKGAPVLLGAGVLLAGIMYFGEIFSPAADADAIPPPTSETATLLVVETESCGWCKRFRRDVAPTYPESGYAHRAPLRFVLLQDLNSTGYRMTSSVRAVPTFILIDREGREVDRLRGYPGGGKAFYGALDRMLARAPADKAQVVR